MNDTDRFNWLAAHGAALVVGIVTLAFFFIGRAGLTGVNLPAFPMAVLLILLVAGAAWWAYAKGRRETALGLVAGYAVLSLISGGQCTLLVEDDFDAPLNVLTGLLGYLGLLVVSLLAGGIYSVIRNRRDREETGP